MTRRHIIQFTAATVSLVSVALLLSKTPETSPFLEKPYLQLGDSPKQSASESLMLLWHTSDAPAEWKVEVRTS